MKTADFPVGSKNLGPGLLKDINGYVWRKCEDSDNWYPESPTDVALMYEETLAKTVLSIFSGGLEESGDVVQVRRVGDRLTWIKANKSDQKWQELTPEIARRIEVEAVLEGQKLIDAEKKEKLKAMKIGWYQDSKGDLYQFDGETWLGRIPSKNEIETLEYLG
jgi:hypothetical protein